MTRMTRRIDKNLCRIAEPGGCAAEYWIERVTGVDIYGWQERACDHCIFKKYINRLAEYEDEAERMEDDKK